MGEGSGDQGFLVGRGASRDGLRAALDHVEAGTGGVALVHGDAGIGKTELVRQVLDHRSLPILWGTASPLDRDLAYAPLVAALTDHLDRQPLPRRNELTSGLDVLGTIMDGYGWSPPPSVEPAIDRTRRAEAVRRMLDRITLREPAVLVIDDVQWADAATLGVLQRVAHEPDQRPLLLIVTFRPDELGDARTLVSRLRRLRTTAEIALDPLDDADAEELLRRWVGEELPALDRRELVRRAGGNPLFLDALARGWSIDRRVPPEPPVVAGDLLLARLEGADESTRMVLDVLAVAGTPIALPALARVLGRPDVVVEAAASILEGLGLLRSDTDGRIGVAHPLVLEAAYAVVPPVRRQRLHAAFARDVSGPQDLGVRARHLRLAGPHVEPHEALPVLETAGERAVARLAGREAVNHLTAAVDLARVHAPGRLPRLLELLALGWYAQRETGATMAVLDDAIAAARHAGEAAVEARCHHLLAVIHWYGNRYDQARAAHARATAMTTGDDDPGTQASLLLGEAHQAFSDTDTETVADAAEGLRRLADLTGLRVVEAAAQLGAAWLAQLEGRLPDVLVHTGDCLDAYDGDGVTQPALQAIVPRARAARAMACAALGRPEEVGREVTAMVATADAPLAAWRAHLAAFGMACEAGALEDIETTLGELRTSLNDATRAETAAVLALLAGWAALAREHVDEVQAAVEASRAATPAGGANRSMPRAIADLCCALAVATDAPPPAAATQPPAAPWATPPWGHEARLLLAIGNAGAAGDVAAIRRTLRAMGEPGDLPDLMVQRADALACRDADPPAAGARLAAVAEQADARGLRRRAARCWVEAAELLADDERAVAAGHRGLGLAERVGAVSTADRARRALRRRGVRVAPAATGRGPLTARQRDVAALVAEGLTNAEIATRLFISVRTVTTHLDNIYTALGITSRAQLATWWATRDT